MRQYTFRYQLKRVANEYRWLDNLRESPVPTALIWGLQDQPNPPRIGNHIWYNYLDKRSVESSYWMLPTAGHFPQREVPEEMAGIVRTCLEVGIPAPEDENAFMRTLAPNRTRDVTGLHGSLHHRETSTSQGPSRTRRTGTAFESALRLRSPPLAVQQNRRSVRRLLGIRRMSYRIPNTNLLTAFLVLSHFWVYRRSS